YRVELLEAPPMAGGAGRVQGLPRLRRPTTERSELPAEARRWLERIEAAALPDWERAVAARDFVQRHYVYDEHFLDRPEVRARLTRLEPGRGQHHLRLLHASQAPGVLGRGICYELNLQLVELLRHLQVPAM